MNRSKCYILCRTVKETEQVVNAIVTNVEERCRCNFTRSNITPDRSLCFPRSDFNAVTYRGDIH